MTTTTINGRTYSDGSEPGIGLAGGGHRTLLLPLVSDIVAVASQVATNAGTAVAKAVDAAGSRDAAAASAVTSGAAAAVATGAAVQVQAAAAQAQAVVLGVSTGRPPSRPLLLMALASARALDPRAVYARSTAAWRYNEVGLLEQQIAGAPLFDFSPSTMACRGLLIEGALVNLARYSEQIDNATWWSSVNCALTPNAVTAPDGALSADKVVPASGLAGYVIPIGPSVVAGNTYTQSVFLRPAGFTSVRLLAQANMFADALSRAVDFNLSAGTFAPVTAGGFGAGHSAAMEPLPGGWYRCSITWAAGVTVASGVQIRGAVGGDGVSGFYVWGAMLVDGPIPGSYIPTTSAQAARTATTCSIPVAGWLRQGVGTVCVEFARPWAVGASEAPRVLTLHDGTADNRIAIVLSRGASSDQVGAFITAGGVGTFSGAAATYTAGATVRAAIAYQANDAVLYVNGVQVWAGSSGAIPSALTTLALGTDSAGGNHLNGSIGRVAYWPGRLANAHLQTLTAA